MISLLHPEIKLELLYIFITLSPILLPILGKNGTGNKGTNEKVGKNGTLMLNFPKPQTQPLPSKHPIPP